MEQDIPKLEVISSCLVRTTSNATSISTLELTSWDLPLLQTTCIQKGLVFCKPQSPQNFILHLQNSLSRTLDMFPPLAGRLATTAFDDDMVSFFVDCNNAGAEFSHAVAPAVSVSDIMDANYTPEIVSSFFPLKEALNLQGVSSPLFGVQITELADGIFIGCTANHAVVDGVSFWHFINSWSQISRGFHTILKAPVFDRWFPSNVGGDNRVIHLPTLEKNLYNPPSSSPQKVFHFSRECSDKLKAMANCEAKTDKISSLQAVLAHVWRSTTRCGWVNESTREAVILMAIGTRTRLSLEDGYFGNAVCLAASSVGEGEMLQKGIGHTALKINDLVSQQTKEAVTSYAERKVEYMRLEGTANWPLMVVGSARHDVYGNDFGWGKPIAVRSGKVHKYEGMVVVLPAAGGRGIDLEVCLPKETLEAMEDDAEFIRAFTAPVKAALSEQR